MKATLSTRKPVDKISLDDLRIFPVWEYALDEEGQPGQDETWIKPVKTAVVPTEAWSQIVAASFAGDASVPLMGFMVVTTARQPFEFSPGAIVTESAYYFIPSPRMSGSRRLRAAITQALGITFPLCYSLLVPIAGESQLREGMVV
jgi:hypothetical protein